MLLCGRPTKQGKPCANQGTQWNLPCLTHQTDADRDLRVRLDGAYRSGLNDGRARGLSEAEFQRINEARKVVSHYTANGDQVVQVGNWTYVWRGQRPLAVGDRVELPGGGIDAWNRDPWVGVVSALGSNYRGHMKAVTRLVEQSANSVSV